LMDFVGVGVVVFTKAHVVLQVPEVVLLANSELGQKPVDVWAVVVAEETRHFGFRGQASAVGFG